MTVVAKLCFSQKPISTLANKDIYSIEYLTIEILTQRQVTPETLTQRQVDQRYNAGQKLEETVQTIRTLPGFVRFLLAPPEDELRAAAEYGSIVVINVSTYRCDALIIENSRIRSLELTRLHISDIQDRTIEDLADPKTLKWL